jgi:hypothetical protein
MRELLDGTEKYETIKTIESASANDLKAKIRAAVNNAKLPAELFFYYTGHGYSYEEEFFYCATNFDSNRRTKQVCPRPTSTRSYALPTQFGDQSRGRLQFGHPSRESRDRAHAAE